MKFLPLSQGLSAIVDDDDFERVSQFKWFVHRGADSGPYARRSYFNKKAEKGLPTLMHMFIMGPYPEGKTQIDHVNRNGLDNRKANLRFCTRSENRYNLIRKNSTGYKGVVLDKRCTHKKYVAQINRSQKLGWFKTPEEAAKAYDKEARRLFGAFARTNFPEE